MKDEHNSQDQILGEIEKLSREVLESEATDGMVLGARRQVDAMGRLAAYLAHAFNEHLTAIMGATQLLMNDVDAEDPLRATIAVIHEAGSKAARLTRQLQAFSRREGERLEELNLNDILRRMQRSIETLITSDIMLVTHLDPHLGSVKVRLKDLQQVILSLVENARDAMPEGGTLTITTDNFTLDEPYRQAFPRAQDPGRFVRMSVTDTRSSIDPEAIDRMFKPFVSAGDTGNLSLALANHTIEQSGGWIDVYSEEGQGATFRLYLPALLKKKDEAPRSDSVETLQGKAERILFVEDDELVRKITSRVLRSNNYVVIEASSAEEAMTIYEREEGLFDLVFADVVLPGRSGIELVDDLISRKPDVRVLLCSGYADYETRWTDIHTRGLSLIQKPYAVIDLLRTIQAIVAS